MEITNFTGQIIVQMKLTHYFDITVGMPRHAWPHPLEMIEYVCCFYVCLITYKNSTSYLNSFVRYCSLKNLAFWLAWRFMDHNSRTSFFPHMQFFWKVGWPLVLSNSSKQIIYEWVRFFVKTPKATFLGIFGPSWSVETFFQSWDFVTFLFLWLSNFIQKIRKNWYANWDLALQMDRQTDGGSERQTDRGSDKQGEIDTPLLFAHAFRKSISTYNQVKKLLFQITVSFGPVSPDPLKCLL